MKGLLTSRSGQIFFYRESDAAKYFMNGNQKWPNMTIEANLLVSHWRNDAISEQKTDEMKQP